MAILYEIEVKPYKKFVSGTGEVVFSILDSIDLRKLGEIRLGKDHIRRLYYRVLGLGKSPGISIDDQIEEVTVMDVGSVDVPEDMLVEGRRRELQDEFRAESARDSECIKKARIELGSPGSQADSTIYG